jgi:hypothetical protein
MNEEELEYGFYLAYNASMFFIEDFQSLEIKKEILEQDK